MGSVLSVLSQVNLKGNKTLAIKYILLLKLWKEIVHNISIFGIGKSRAVHDTYMKLFSLTLICLTFLNYIQANLV